MRLTLRLSVSHLALRLVGFGLGAVRARSDYLFTEVWIPILVRARRCGAGK